MCQVLQPWHFLPDSLWLTLQHNIWEQPPNQTTPRTYTVQCLKTSEHLGLVPCLPHSLGVRVPGATSPPIRWQEKPARLGETKAAAGRRRSAPVGLCAGAGPAAGGAAHSGFTPSSMLPGLLSRAALPVVLVSEVPALAALPSPAPRSVNSLPPRWVLRRLCIPCRSQAVTSTSLHPLLLPLRSAPSGFLGSSLPPAPGGALVLAACNSSPPLFSETSSITPQKMLWSRGRAGPRVWAQFSSLRHCSHVASRTPSTLGSRALLQPAPFSTFPSQWRPRPSASKADDLALRLGFPSPARRPPPFFSCPACQKALLILPAESSRL